MPGASAPPPNHSLRSSRFFRIGRGGNFLPGLALVARAPELRAEVAEVQRAQQLGFRLQECGNRLAGKVVLGDLCLAQLEESLARPDPQTITHHQPPDNACSTWISL